MVKINLRDYYKEYSKDEYLEVSYEVYDTLLQFKRLEEAQKKKRHKAYFSLDCNDGIEKDCLNKPHQPDAIWLTRTIYDELRDAIESLPARQIRHLYLLFYCNLRKSDIARLEGVSWQTIDRSIRKSLLHIKESLKLEEEEKYS